MPSATDDKMIWANRAATPWRSIGQNIAGAMSPSEAITHLGLDFKLALQPLGFVWENKFHDVPTRRVIVREPKGPGLPPIRLGEASANYVLMQNTQIGTLLDSLASYWPLETIATLDDGKIFFAALEIGAGEIAGEGYERYLLLSDTRDGKSSFRVQYAINRIVCRNTLNLELAGDVAKVNIPHTQNLQSMAALAISLLAQLKGVQTSLESTLSTLAKTPASDNVVASTLSIAWPDKKTAQLILTAADAQAKGQLIGEQQLSLVKSATSKLKDEQKRVDDWKGMALTCYDKINDEHPKIAGTKYALLQAVVEAADWRTPKNERAHTSSLIWGERSKIKAAAFAHLAKNVMPPNMVGAPTSVVPDAVGA